MKNLIAKVVSAKTSQTVKVEVERSFAHPKYKKIIKRTMSMLVHNTTEGIKEGDNVKITSCRPYSKRKNFVVVSKV